MAEANLNIAVLAETTFLKAKLNGALLENLSALDDYNLEGTNLTNATILGVDFTKASLTGADFTNATVRNSDFTGKLLTM